MTPPIIHLMDVSYHYSQDRASVAVLDRFTLAVRTGEILGIFGPNGCGKSSLLNVVTGMLRAHRGVVHINRAAEVRMSYVAQDYAQTLLPWFRIQKNLLLPLRYRGVSRAEAEARLEALLAFFSYPVDLRTYPCRLSGGQQQIAALLRGLIQDPHIMLLDEPFSAINFYWMFALRQKLALWAKKQNISMLIVSHNLDDLMIVCDRVLAVDGPPLNVLAETCVTLPHPRREYDLVSPEITHAKARIYRHSCGESKPCVPT